MKRLKFIREAKGITAAQLAKEARVHAGDLSRIERGLMVPYQGQLERLAAALRWEDDPELLLGEVIDDIRRA